MQAWYVVYTRARNEKKVSARLAEIGVEVYCPVKTTLRQWSDRKKKVVVPVFPSYVFVHSDLSDKDSILQTPGVVRFVPYLGRPARIRDCEMEQLVHFLQAYESPAIENIDFRRDDVVQVDFGVMRGRRGKVLEAEKGKVRLLIEELGIQLIAEIPTQHVKKEQA